LPKNIKILFLFLLKCPFIKILRVQGLRIGVKIKIMGIEFLRLGMNKGEETILGTEKMN